MFQVPSSAMRRLARPADSSPAQASAPGRLRERVLAGVRGEPMASGPGQRRATRRLLAPTLALLVGVALGAVLAPTLNFGGAARSRSAPARPGASASLREVGDRAELILKGMPEPPVGEVYELWVLRPGGSPQPTDALFTVTSSGAGTVDVPGGVGNGIGEVLVTREARGGSPIPTSPPVLRVKVPGAN